MAKSPASSWSFLRDSPKLRGVLKYKLDESGLTLVQLASNLNMRTDSLSRYFRAVKPSITEYDLVRLADYFDIDLTLDINLRNKAG